MRTMGPTANAVLGVIGQGTGAMALPFGLIARTLTERGIQVEKTALYHILKRLIRNGKITKVGFLYTLPATLSRPGYPTLFEGVTRFDIRKREGTSEKTFRNRENRAIHRWQNDLVRRGAHDHRSLDRPCPLTDKDPDRCYEWPPPWTGGFPGLAWNVKAKMPISGFCQY